MNQELYETVKSILVNTFQVPEEDVSPDATFESLDLDSLDLVEFTLALEEEVGVEIEDEEAEDIRTVEDAVTKIEEKQKVQT
ncbi:MAG: acyl carrier protein [Actinobacteria bacterium]|nr:acyl carrier protein [Actinomycetota bacterium]MDP9023325.1 acyl carrier protein [Actinomycetota bacterium]